MSLSKEVNLRDIHIGDWLKVCELNDLFSRPMEVSGIFSSGNILLTDGEEEVLRDISTLEAIPISEQTLKAFGFEITDNEYKIAASGHVFKDTTYIGMLVSVDGDVCIKTDQSLAYFMHQLAQVMYDERDIILNMAYQSVIKRNN